MDRFVVDLVECPSVSRTSAVARVSGVWPAVGRLRLSSGVGPTVGWVRYSASVCPACCRPFFLGKVAFDAVGLGVGPPCLRVDSEEALLKRTDERAPLARAAPGATPEKKLVTKSWMIGRQETMNGAESMKYVPEMTASVWMPLNQTCIKESGDADLTLSKRRPGTPVGHKVTNSMR